MDKILYKAICIDIPDEKLKGEDSRLNLKLFSLEMKRNMDKLIIGNNYYIKLHNSAYPDEAFCDVTLNDKYLGAISTKVFYNYFAEYSKYREQRINEILE